MLELEWKIIRPENNELSTTSQLLIWLQRLKHIGGYLIKTTPKSLLLLWKQEKVVFQSEDYYVDGEAIDSEWIVKNRPILQQYLLDDMRDHGYIPIIDMSPGLVITEYVEETKTFKYKLSARGLLVGRDKSYKYLGILAEQGIAVAADSSYVSLVDAI